MRNSDLLARLGGLLMLVSAAWNVVAAVAWILSFFLFLVGFLWVIPLVLAFVQIGIALVSLAFGNHRAVVAGPLIGLFVSLCNLNVPAMMLELLNLGLMVGSSVARAAEDRGA
ncbi:MAG: hypothetical protein R3F59_28115 [Myxococcota bacterium]